MHQVQYTDLYEAGVSKLVKSLLERQPHPVTTSRRVSASRGDSAVVAPSAGGFQRGGLAPWHVAKIKGLIEAKLDERLTTADMAASVRLSASHFSRAFRASLGASPHLYVVRRRIERAKHLMTITQAPLCEIALACGLADQAHFSRLFHHHVGEPPNAWRRRRTGPGHTVSGRSRRRSVLPDVGQPRAA